MPGRVSNPGPLTYESDAIPIAPRGPAKILIRLHLNCMRYNPAGTCRRNGVVLTSMRRHYAASTSVRRHFNVVCPLVRPFVSIKVGTWHYCKLAKYLEKSSKHRGATQNRVLLNENSIRVYTVCHAISRFWAHCKYKLSHIFGRIVNTNCPIFVKKKTWSII